MEASFETEFIVSVDNKPGTLMELTRMLREEDVNIVGVCCPPEHEWGRIFVLVEETEKGRKILEDAGYHVSEREVIAVETDHQPGVLSKLTTPIGEKNINIDYLYATASGQRSVVVLQPKSNEEAMELLKEHAGVEVD